MPSPRIRRLESEHAEMVDLAKASSMVEFSSHGTPPTRYQVVLTCTGIASAGNMLIPVMRHEFDLILSPEFPMLEPTIVWRTPVFHPNIRPPHVCTGDIWFAGSSLAELCVALCEMVQYKSFNVYHPLDRDAALWLLEYLKTDSPEIPLDPRPVRDLDFEITPDPKTPPP
jgi:ubiquitin-protein ligase